MSSSKYIFSNDANDYDEDDLKTPRQTTRSKFFATDSDDSSAEVSGDSSNNPESPTTNEATVDSLISMLEGKMASNTNEITISVSQARSLVFALNRRAQQHTTSPVTPPKHGSHPSTLSESVPSTSTGVDLKLSPFLRKCGDYGGHMSNKVKREASWLPQKSGEFCSKLQEVLASPENAEEKLICNQDQGRKYSCKAFYKCIDAYVRRESTNGLIVTPEVVMTAVELYAERNRFVHAEYILQRNDPGFNDADPKSYKKLARKVKNDIDAWSSDIPDKYADKTDHLMILMRLKMRDLQADAEAVDDANKKQRVKEDVIRIEKKDLSPSKRAREVSGNSALTNKKPRSEDVDADAEQLLEAKLDDLRMTITNELPVLEGNLLKFDRILEKVFKTVQTVWEEELHYQRLKAAKEQKKDEKRAKRSSIEDSKVFDWAFVSVH